MMTALIAQTQTITHAHVVNKDDGPFECPACNKPAIVKKGPKKIHHFAHKVMDSRCALASDRDRVSQRHMNIQWQIFEAFNQQPERFVTRLEKQIGHHWTDVALYDRKTKRKYAIEIQRSPISIDQIESRTSCYSANGFLTLWIVAKEFECGAVIPSEAGSEQQRIASWIRDLHKLHCGVIFYHVSNQILELVHFEEATSFVEYREWGNGESAGGYDRTLKGSRILDIASFQVAIDELVAVKNRYFGGSPLVAGIPYERRWWS